MSTDDEADLSPSLSAKYESPAKAKREALKQKLQKEGGKQDTDTPAADLKKLQLSMLKNQVAGKDEDQTRKEKQNNKAPTSFVTKTREQEIVAQKQTADMKPSSDQMVEQGKQAAQAMEELKKDEAQSEDA